MLMPMPTATAETINAVIIGFRRMLFIASLTLYANMIRSRLALGGL
jgi:hypothetical protein